jgi:hypothetical protein
MSTIRFRLESTIAPVKAAARYLPMDYTLSVGPGGQYLTNMHRISIDTLTLLFTPDKHVLTGLDAYTNSERWYRRHLTDPPVVRETALVCIEPFDEHGIGKGGDAPVRYTYSDEAALLLIELGDGRAVTRVRCLSCVVCGIGGDGDLLEIWIQGLTLSHNRREGEL